MPALQRGLALLELVAQSAQPVAFNEIRRRLGLPKASAARLLGWLRKEGYLEKEPSSGRYCLGRRAVLLSGSATLTQRLAVLGEPLLRELRDGTSCTTLLIRLAEGRATCLAKVESEAGIPMQQVGTVRLDQSKAPWGLIYYDAMSGTERRKARGHMASPSDLDRLRRSAAKCWPALGYVYDDQAIVKHVRRLAAPVHYQDQLVAAVGLGGNPLTMPDSAVRTIGEAVVQTAARLESLLKGDPDHS